MIIHHVYTSLCVILSTFVVSAFTIQQLVLSVPHDTLEWNANNSSGEFHLGNEDGTIDMVIYTRQTALLSGLVRAIEHHNETERQRQKAVRIMNEAKQVGHTQLYVCLLGLL